MIVIDVESTGVHPNTCAIVAIGAVDFEHPYNEFYEECSMFDGADINTYSLNVNGFSADDIQPGKKQSQRDLMSKFLNWSAKMGKPVLAGWNVSFSYSFVAASAVREGLARQTGSGVSWHFGYRSVDLHSLVYAHMYARRGDPGNISFEDAMKYAGLPRRAPVQTALDDAKAQAEVLSRVIRGKGLFAEFDAATIPDTLAKK